MNFSMQGLVQFAPKIIDNRSVLSDAVSVTTNLTNGTTAGKADGYWSGTITLAAGTDNTIDLTALSFAAFGLTGTVNLASVKHLAVVNQSANVKVTVDLGGSNGWDQIGGLYVGAGGVLVMHSPAVGFPVSGSSKVIRFTSNDSVTTLTGSTTTGSASVSGLSSTTGLAAGMKVTGTGIPSGTTIVSITNGTTILVSAAATATSGSGGTSLNFAWPDAVVKVYVAGILH